MAIVASIAGFAPGQSINIDFGNEAGSPPGEYAAAGLAGVWNVVDSPWKFPPPPVIGPLPLVDLAGRPTGATISMTDSLGTIAFDPLPTPGPNDENDQRLLNDGLIGHSPGISQVISIDGLQNGRYRLLTYTWVWSPADAFGMVVFVTGSKAVQVVSGHWQGGLQLPVTHMSHTLQVTDGHIQMEVVGAGPGASFNGNNVIQGVQVWRIDPPARCVADIAPEGGNGAVDVDDLILVILSWGQTDVPADINGSGVVDVDDLIAVILNWGPCAGGPVKCGAAGLGDCYAAHSAAGCNEPACCTAVCALDPYCCDSEWDVICADLANATSACANAVPANCGNPAAGSCFDANDALPGCADSTCCAAVCAVNPYCCTFEWDLICVELAELFCGRIPPTCGHPESGDCFTPHFTPFCIDAECCEAVCAIDPFCCETEWDELCVEMAKDMCVPASPP
jgi:hypothetical protein